VRQCTVSFLSVFFSGLHYHMSQRAEERRIRQQQQQKTAVEDARKGRGGGEGRKEGERDRRREWREEGRRLRLVQEREGGAGRQPVFSKTKKRRELMQSNTT
jgi:hypothetical protein